MGFLLSIIAYVLFMPVAVLNFITVMIVFSREDGFWKVTDKYWKKSAIDIDIFGNYHYRTLWNTLLITKEGYLFGVREETISSALGKNQRDDTLTWLGWFLVYVLWAVDYKYWGKGGHCINVIQEFDFNGNMRRVA